MLKRRAALGGVVLGIIAALVFALWLYIGGLKSDIESQRKQNASLSAGIALCESEKLGLSRAIEDQNTAIRRSQEQAERMKAQGEAARAEARQAQEAAEQAIARMRREDAIHQSCEEARQLLIQEAMQ